MQGISPFICRLFNRTCVAECICAFQIKCTPVSRDESRIGEWFLPRLHSSMRFTEKQRCTTALSSFFPFFSAWEYIYSASGVPEKHGCLRAWPSFCHSVWVSTSTSFLRLLPSLFSSNFNAQYSLMYYLSVKHSYRISVIEYVIHVMKIFFSIFFKYVFSLFIGLLIIRAIVIYIWE